MNPDLDVLQKVTSLLQDDEAPPYEVVNSHGRGEAVLIVDHASNRIPRCLRNLGLTPALLDTHIAWDAGAAAVARALAALLDAPLLLANYSRLVIDCNRAPGSTGSILAVSDHVVVPGNQQLSAADKAARQRLFFDPYHAAIAALLDQRRSVPTVLLGVHSFTPVLQGQQRPWHLGICYDRDSRLAKQLLALLKPGNTAVIGNNEPYTIEEGIDYSLPWHAGRQALPHVMLEFRSDAISTTDAVTAWSEAVADALLRR
jgi:predicted N-formylglutamate amidohydrolase